MPDLPADIHPQSGFRLPLPKREDLDAHGQSVLDSATAPGARPHELHGPLGVMLYTTKAGALQSALNRYLRFEAGITPRMREIAILTAAREADSQFEWVQHEGIALREGVEASLIDVIRHRKGVDGLDPTEAAVIAFGRELFGDHKVKPQTFAQIKAAFGPNKLVDLVMLMANYVAMGAVLTAVDLQLRPGQKPLLPIP